MESRKLRHGSESQDSDDPVTPGVSLEDKNVDSSSTSSPVPQLSSKGVENAKKRLRAFSIQKKTAIPLKPSVKPVSSGNTTVLIGKLSGVKVTPKPEKPDDETIRPPRPPKPGGNKKILESDPRRKTLTEIEEMKRKMELVELGIPLGLICPSTNALPVKAMPTKAMPPIKTFLDSAKVDEIIREAKKAKAEGKEFKFDYQKFVPDYDNPFQRKKDCPESAADAKDLDKVEDEKKGTERERRRSEHKYDHKHDYGRDSKDRFKESFKDPSRKEDKSKDRVEKAHEREDRSRDKEKSRDKDKEKLKDDRRSSKKDCKSSKDDDIKKKGKEAEVDLNDFLVCDSWSLDADDKTASPQIEKAKALRLSSIDPMQQLRASLGKKVDVCTVETSNTEVKKLQPVIDSFEFEIDPKDEMFDDDANYLDARKHNVSGARSKKYGSPNDDYDVDLSNDCMDDTFLESVIDEIKADNMYDDDNHEKSLVEYDESPNRDSKEPSVGSGTPEMDDRSRSQSQKSNYSDSNRSTESRKSVESGYKSSESGLRSLERSYGLENQSHKYNDYNIKEVEDIRMSVDKDEGILASKMSKDTMESLETWSFVLKICQPLLFRHDKNKCYKETRVSPKVWYTQNPKLCNCVKDRTVVYEELEMCKTSLVDRLYGCDQIPDSVLQCARTWYPRLEQCLVENPVSALDMTTDWDIEESAGIKVGDQRVSMTPDKVEEVSLDREYQKFMEAVLGETDTKVEDSRSTTPVRNEGADREEREIREEREGRKKKLDDKEDKKRAKKMRLSSDGWSQESEVDDEKTKPVKVDKTKEKQRKRKHSASSISSESAPDDSKKNKKKSVKKKEKKKEKQKSAKRRRLQKKILIKMKDGKAKKKKKKEEPSDFDEVDTKQAKKKEKKIKKKKQKAKKKDDKKKKKVESSSSSSSYSSSDTSSESHSENERRIKKKKVLDDKKKKKKKDRKKKRKQSTSESQSEEIFDVNVLNNMKIERDAPPHARRRDIIDVKELHHDFSYTHIKQEAEEESKRQEPTEPEPEVQPSPQPTPKPAQKVIPQEKEETKVPEPKPQSKQRMIEVVQNETCQVDLMNRFDLCDSNEQNAVNEDNDCHEFKELDIPTPPPRPDDTSQCSSQESVVSIKDNDNTMLYEKDESHLRPSSQNSNYNFNDVIASSAYKTDDKFDGYENYEMYEQLAMAYQSDVANQMSVSGASPVRCIETVVRARGEIKCDWKPGDTPAPTTLHRPSRWGLKPGDANIILTGHETESNAVYSIQSLANRNDPPTVSYDEAYMDTYGASDKLQYGDCFSSSSNSGMSQNVIITPTVQVERSRSLDDRINKVLNDTVLGEAVKDEIDDKSPTERGILITKSVSDNRSVKRVSFADGYKPGQDSDVEEPPVKKRKKVIYGCAWPCPESHPAHVSLWDALPPPPPPPGSPPPPPPSQGPPIHLLRQHQLPQHQHIMMHHAAKGDPIPSLSSFMPPEPPPGLITFT